MLARSARKDFIELVNQALCTGSITSLLDQCHCIGVTCGIDRKPQQIERLIVAGHTARLPHLQLKRDVPQASEAKLDHSQLRGERAKVVDRGRPHFENAEQIVLAVDLHDHLYLPPAGVACRLGERAAIWPGTRHLGDGLRGVARLALAPCILAITCAQRCAGAGVIGPVVRGDGVVGLVEKHLHRHFHDGVGFPVRLALHQSVLDRVLGKRRSHRPRFARFVMARADDHPRSSPDRAGFIAGFAVDLDDALGEGGDGDGLEVHVDGPSVVPESVRSMKARNPALSMALAEVPRWLLAVARHIQDRRQRGQHQQNIVHAAQTDLVLSQRKLGQRHLLAVETQGDLDDIGRSSDGCSAPAKNLVRLIKF